MIFGKSVYFAVLTLLLCMVVVVGACANRFRPESPDSSEDFFIAPSQPISDNGFRVVVLADRRQASVRMTVRYTVGAGQDPEGKEGLAHLVEHLMFALPASSEADSETIGTALGRLSDSWTGETAIDTTTYSSEFAPDKLSSVFALEMRRAKLGCRGISEERFLRERELVRHEVREQMQTATARLQHALYQFMFVEGHPSRSAVTETESSLLGITLKDACDFVDEHYTPANTIIVISGGTSAEEVEKETRKWFRSFPASAARSEPIPPRSFVAPSERTETMQVDTQYLFAIWPLAPASSNEHALQVQVGRGLDDALQAKVKTAPWAIASQTFVIGGLRAPALVAAIALRTPDASDRARKLLEETVVGVLGAHGSYTDRDVEKRKLLTRYENPRERLELFADYSQYGYFGGSLESHLERLDAIDEADVAAAARRLLEGQERRVLVVQPEHAQEGEQVTYFESKMVSPAQRSLLSVDEEAAPTTNEGAPEPDTLSDKQQVRRYRLKNGLNLLFWVNHDVPLAYGTLVLPVGAAQVPEGLEGVASLLPGTDGYDATIFSESALSKNAGAMLSRLAKRFQQSDERIARSQLKRTKRRFEQPEDQAADDFEKRMRTALYGDGHPYTRVRLTSNSAKKISMNDIVRWAKARTSVRGATLIVTGRFNPELMYRHVLYNFELAPSHRLRVPNKLPSKTISTGPTVVVGHRDQGERLSISVAYRGASGHTSDQPARDVLAKILDDRLRRLRDEKVLAYDIHAEYVPERGQGLWWLSGDVDGDHSGEAMEHILIVVAQLRSSRELLLREFASAHSSLLSRYDGTKVTAAEAAARLRYQTRYGLEDDYFDNYVRLLARVGPDDIERLLQNEFATDRRVVGLYGPNRFVDLAQAAITFFDVAKALEPEPKPAREEPAPESGGASEGEAIEPSPAFPPTAAPASR